MHRHVVSVGRLLAIDGILVAPSADAGAYKTVPEGRCRAKVEVRPLPATVRGNRAWSAGMSTGGCRVEVRSFQTILPLTCLSCRKLWAGCSSCGCLVLAAQDAVSRVSARTVPRNPAPGMRSPHPCARQLGASSLPLPPSSPHIIVHRTTHHIGPYAGNAIVSSPLLNAANL